MAMLVLTLPNGDTEPMELGRDRYTIGRSRSCDIRLSDPKVSRVHAEIVRGAGGIWHVRDAGSANHTYVNGRPVTEHELQDGDAVQVGPALFHFKDGGSTTTRMALTTVDDNQNMASQSLVGSPSQRLALNEARLRTMYDLLSRLSGAAGRAQILQEVMDLVARALDGERGFIGMQEEKKTFEVVAQVRMDIAGTVPVSRSMLHQAAGLGNTVLYPNPKSNMGLNEHSISTLNIHSAVAAPIAVKGRPGGVLYLDRIKSFRPFTPDDLDFAVAVARELGVWEENRRLMDAERQRMDLESRMQMARKVQQDLFPAYPPEFNGYRIQAHNIPCTDASGDTYDVIDLGNGRLALSIGDVAGKGIGAAMLASNIQASYRTAVRAARHEADINLARVIENVNETVSAGLANIKFVTFLAAVLDTRNGNLVYCNAGHNFAVLLHADGTVEQLREGHNTILGIPDTEAFVQGACRFPPDASLILYTDGIVEALNSQSAQFTYERFAECLRAAAGRPASALVDVICDAVEAFVGDGHRSDDVTLLVLSGPKIKG